MREILTSLRDYYTSIYENKKKIRLFGIIAFVIITIVNIINSFLYYDINYLIEKEIYMILIALGVILFLKIFHGLFGKWFIHETRLQLTKDYIREKLPKSVKYDGFRGVGKDTTVNALRKAIRDNMIECIEEETELIQIVCYPYDFERLGEYLTLHYEDFPSSSKSKFFDSFIQMMKENNCFIKKTYAKDFDIEKEISELYEMKKNPLSIDNDSITHKFDDGITRKHYLSMIIKYAMYFIRLNYYDNFIFSNQPLMETDDKSAKLFSTRFTNIRKENSEWPWPVDGNIMILETEVDGLYPNVGKTESAMTTGLRDFKAFYRHFMGEQSVWFQIGQNAGRTEKSLRELDFAFIRVIDQAKVFGGEKRIFLIRLWMKWVNFWIKRSLTNKAREKQIRRKSKAYERIIRLKNTGYIYVDLRVSRSDSATTAKEMSIKEVLKYDKPIFENYMIKLCFQIKDTYFGINSHYIESIGEMKARKSKIEFKNTMSWDPDLVLKKKHIVYMEYPVMDKIINFDRKKAEKLKKDAEAKLSAALKKESESDALEGVQEET